MDHWNNRMEKKRSTSATKELEKASLGEGLNRVVGKPTTKRVSLVWADGKRLKI